ncbi:MAG: hexulose-6-phosphate synthase [Gammaproteobacteria bacterium RIFCSPHIGHO2_12_FULL_40_19]|nr:MAG: hexulose-6-phosphate synthase [Gammaproteobacteria bacterium RIFCSPHIGHO2_12_FULL_40_19]
MTKREKILDRLLSKPTDFTWVELTKVLNGFGYSQISAGKTGGSRVRFVHANYPPIILHKPHPKPILKRYQLEGIIDLLKQEKLI